MRATLKAINDQLAARGYNARLEKADGYCYFSSGEAAGWLDRTVQVPTVSSLTPEQWLEEFHRLKALYEGMLSRGGDKAPRPVARRVRKKP